MSTETALATTDRKGTGAMVFNAEQLDLIKKTICPGTSDDELKLFVAVCNRTKLDPFSRQIHGVMRRKKEDGKWVPYLVIQTGIDGYRLIAQRQGDYIGRVKTAWYDAAGVEHNIWLDDENHPVAAVVWVRKKIDDEFHDIAGIAHYRGYVQRNAQGHPTQRWKTDPAAQLAKCAEAMALRAGWPQELSDVYTDVEMQQADNPEGGATIPQPQRVQPAITTKVVNAEEVPSEIIPDDDDCESVVTTIATVGERSGNTKGKPWTLHIINAEAGTYITFDKKIASCARLYEGTGQEVELYYDEQQGKRDPLLRGLQPASDAPEPEAGTPDSGPQEPGEDDIPF